MQKPILPAFLALALLAACGSSGGGAPAPAPTPDVLGPASFVETYPDYRGWADARYDPDRDLFRLRYVTEDGRTLVQQLARNPGIETGLPTGFAAYGANQTIALRGETGSGQGSVYAVRSMFDGIEYGIDRAGDTILPTTGSATFGGGYAGVLGDGDNMLENAGVITGSATLTADFGRATVSGEITDRINGNDRAFGDLRLLPTAIIPETGGFGGHTSGGILTGLNYTAATGSYDGLFVGPRGGEVVGGVEVTHIRNGSPTIVEYGGFVLQK